MEQQQVGTVARNAQTQSPLPLLISGRDGKNTSRHFARTAPTEEVGRGIRVYSLGVTAADYDNDGDQDFYLTTFGESLLFRNEAGEAGAGPLHWIYKRIILYC